MKTLKEQIESFIDWEIEDGIGMVPLDDDEKMGVVDEIVKKQEEEGKSQAEEDGKSLREATEKIRREVDE